jgi:hypothetical protein
LGTACRLDILAGEGLLVVHNEWLPMPLIISALQKAMKILSRFSCLLFLVPISAYTGLFRHIFANKFAYVQFL